MRASEIETAVRAHREKTSHDWGYVTVESGASKEFCRRCGIPRERAKLVDDAGKESVSPCRGFI